VAVWPIVACGTCDLCLADRQHLCRRRRLFGCTPELTGGFATQMAVPQRNLVPLAGNVPPEWGALVEPLAVGEHGVSLAEDRLGEVVVVVGGGPIGIAVALAVRRRGVHVVVVEPLEGRRATLGAMGFAAVPPEETPQEVEMVVECVGHTSTVRAAIAASRPGGTVVCIGLAEPELSVPSVALVVEERRLLGSSAYTYGDFVSVADALEKGEIDPGSMIEARTDLAGVSDAFAAYADGTATAVKTLVIPEVS
jgi:threonine dehydrogenase-like Zn-dependent dehydrogenase